VELAHEAGHPSAVSGALARIPFLLAGWGEDTSQPRGLKLWAVTDNVRKSAALNSLQIAEILVKDYL